MTTVVTAQALPAGIVDSLERIMFAAIGMTSIALTGAAAGGLTLIQWRALVVVGRAEQMRVGVLATAVAMSLPSTSRLVRRLERNGLVSSVRDEADRRATLVALTPSGRRLRDEVVRHRRQLMEEALRREGAGLPDELEAGLAAIAATFEPFS